MDVIRKDVDWWCMSGAEERIRRIQEALSAFLELRPEFSGELGALSLRLDGATLPQGPGRTQLRQLHLAAECSPGGILITDEHVAIEYVNPRFSEITGYSREDVLGRNPSLLKSGLTPINVYQEMWSVLGAGRTWRGELCNRRKDGSLFWQKLSIAPLRERDGRVRHMVATMEDVTERRSSMESLQRLAAAVEQAGEGIAVLDLRGCLCFCNPAFRRMTGLGEGDAAGQTLDAVLRLPGGEEGVEALLRQAQEGEGWRGRLQVERTGGGRAHLEGRVNPVRNAEGQVERLVALLRDVSDEVEMERQLRQVQKMEALGSLAGGVAHDFNNILSAILSATELIEWQVEPDSPLRAKLDIIYQAARRARELNRQILNFSRKSEERSLPFDLSLEAKSAGRLLRATLPASVRLEMELGSSIWVLGDPNQVHQVLMNLAINGCQAMMPGGGTLRLRLGEEGLAEGTLPQGLAPGRYAVLQVEDTGCGMPPEIQEKVFDPFFTTKAPGEGTGLGLSVVHGIVGRHGGSIRLRSEPGKGACFTVLLPCLEGGALPGQAVEETLREELGGVERVLLVDDDELVLALLKQGLQEMGYRVTARARPGKALSLFNANPEAFDLLVTDLAMPQFSGAELARRMRGLRPDFPAILVSGAAQLSDVPLSYTVTFDEVLGKPASAVDLARAIRRVAACRRLEVRHEPQAASTEGASSPLAPCVLLVEDSHVTRTLLRAWLLKAGYRVMEARDGQEALELYLNADDSQQFGMVLTDIVMPRMDGLTLVARLRALDPGLPVLILTSNEDPDSVKAALHLHVNEYLNKPFDSQLLLESVRRLFADRVDRLQARRLAETAQAVRLAQRSMEAVPEKDLPVYSVCEPLTDAGGDVFRCIRRPDGSVLLVLADVAGHSVFSSYAVASFLGMLHTVVQDWHGLRDLFLRLNRNSQTGPFPEIAVSALGATWDMRTGRLHLISAGIPYAVWHRAGLERSEALMLRGTPLGLFDRSRMQESVLVLGEGDRLLLATDGLFDTRSPAREPFESRVPEVWAANARQPLGKALGRLCEAAREHGAGSIADDLLLVGLEQPAWCPGPEELLLTLPSELGVVDQAWGALDARLEGHAPARALSPARHFDLQLAVREALSNAICHGNKGEPTRRVHLACRLDDEGLTLRVVDEGLGFDLKPGLGLPAPDAERGRGLPILQARTTELSMCGGELTFRFDFKGEHP